MKSMTCPFSLQEWGSSQYVAMFSWGKICVWLGLNHRFQVFFVNSMWTHVFCHFHPKEIVDQSVRKGDQVLMPGISWHIVPAAVAYNIWFIWSSVSCFTSLCERRSDTIRYDQIRSDTIRYNESMSISVAGAKCPTIPSDVFFSLVVDSKVYAIFPKGEWLSNIFNP